MADSNKLGLWTSTSLVVGNMIGAGIFLMPSAMASFGGIGLLGWVFSAIGSFFLAKVFSNLSKLVPGANGGPYAYTRAGFGDFAAFLVAWGYTLSICCANAAIVVSFVSAMSVFFPVLAKSSVIAVATGLVTIWFITWVNTRGVIVSGKFQLITTILKLVPLLLVAIGGLFFIKTANFYPFNLSGKPTFDAISTTAAMTMFAFVGIECATIPAGSTENSGKTVSRATMLGVIVVALIYILGSFSVLGLVPAAALEKSATPYADAAVLIYGPAARYIVSGGVAIAAFGALNGWVLVQGQVPAAIAKDKLFPEIFGRLNKKGVPTTGMIISCTVISCLMAMNYSKGLVEQFKFLLLMATLSVLVPYLLSAVAYIVIGAKKSTMVKSGLAGIILLGLVAFIYTIWEIYGTGQQTVFFGFIYLMLGVPFYAWTTYKRNRADN
ncbi:MAG TPA: amino acid permease [Mucilaginibacter sp.]|jgi:APA family basic amino acid/polyamine antiporter|nr:amino acid permease [Mucilaginibacter sp.]